MTSEEIAKIVKEIFQDVMDCELPDLRRETTPDDLEEWDSLATISIIVAIEKEFNIKFDIAEIKPFENFGEVLDIVAAKVG